LNICYVSPYPPQRGGIEAQVESLVSALKDEHEIHVVTYGDRGREEDGVEFYEVDVNDTFLLRGAEFTWGAVKHLKEIGSDMDIIHAHPLHPSGTAAVLSRKFHDTPVLATAHGSDLMRFSRKFPTTFFSSVGNGLDGLVCVSSFLEDRAREIGIESEIHVVPNGVVLEEMKKVEEIDADETVLFVGSLEEHKGPWEVLDVASELPEYDFKLVGDGSLKERLGERIVDEDMENVELLGELPRDEALSWIKSSDCVLMPSEREGFGMVALEAMALNTPVLVHDVPAVNEIVCEESVQDDFVEALRRLEDDGFRENMVEKNQERSKKYGMDRKVKKLEELYGDLKRA